MHRRPIELSLSRSVSNALAAPATDACVGRRRLRARSRRAPRAPLSQSPKGEASAGAAPSLCLWLYLSVCALPQHSVNCSDSTGRSPFCCGANSLWEHFVLIANCRKRFVALMYLVRGTLAWSAPGKLRNSLGRSTEGCHFVLEFYSALQGKAHFCFVFCFARQNQCTKVLLKIIRWNFRCILYFRLMFFFIILPFIKWSMALLTLIETNFYVMQVFLFLAAAYKFIVFIGLFLFKA